MPKMWEALLCYLIKPKFNLATSLSYVEQESSGKVFIEEDLLSIGLKLTYGSLKSIVISYPLSGVICGFRDCSAIGDADCEAYARGLWLHRIHSDPNSPRDEMSEYLELSISNIRPQKQLRFEIPYVPLQRVAKFNRYQVDYSWEYMGKKYNERQIRYIKDDKVQDGGVLIAFQPSVSITHNKTSTFEDLRKETRILEKQLGEINRRLRE